MSQKIPSNKSLGKIIMKRAYSDNSKIVEKTKSVLETMKKKTPISINSSLPIVTKTSFSTSRFNPIVSKLKPTNRKPKKPKTKKKKKAKSPRVGNHIKNTKKGGRKRTRRRRKKKRTRRRRKKKRTRRRKKKRRKSRKRNKRGGTCRKNLIFKHAMEIADFFEEKNQIALGELEKKFNKTDILDRGKIFYEDFDDFFDEVDIKKLYKAAMSKPIGEDQKEEMSENSVLAFMVSDETFGFTYNMLLEKLNNWKRENYNALTKQNASICLGGFTKQTDQITKEPINLLRSYAAYQLLLSYNNKVFGDAEFVDDDTGESWWTGDYQEVEEEDDDEDEDDYDN